MLPCPEEQEWYYSIDRILISWKLNTMVQLKFELAYFETTVQHVSYNTMGKPPQVVFETILCVIYWPSTELSIKRCTCVNKQKNSRSRWALNNNITRCPGRFESAGEKMPKWEPVADKGLWALSDPRMSNPAWMRKKCCYGRRRTWGQYISLSPSPTHLSYTRNITL